MQQLYRTDLGQKVTWFCHHPGDKKRFPLHRSCPWKWPPSSHHSSVAHAGRPCKCTASLPCEGTAGTQSSTMRAICKATWSPSLHHCPDITALPFTLKKAENVQDDPVTSCPTRKQRSYQRWLELCQKESGAKPKRLPTGLRWNDLSIKKNNCSRLV